MKAAAITEFGGPGNIRLMDLPEPVTGPDMVLIRSAAAGVNPVDGKIRLGRLTERFPHHFPLILGWDVAGVVERVGPAVTSVRPGDRVCAYARKACIEHGTYAEYVAAFEETVAPAPESVDLVHAAALPLAGLTALQTIDSLGVGAGQTVVVLGGSGGVGSYGVQLLVDLGARVLATAAEERHSYLQELGALPVDRRGDVAAAVREHAPEGVDAIMDVAAGPEGVAPLLGTLADGARVCSILGVPDLGPAAQERGLTAGYVFVRPNGRQLAGLSAKVDSGRLKIHLHDTFPLDRAGDAHRALEAGGHRGKFAITVP